MKGLQVIAFKGHKISLEVTTISSHFFPSFCSAAALLLRTACFFFEADSIRKEIL